jgi:hypothetical protein
VPGKHRRALPARPPRHGPEAEAAGRPRLLALVAAAGAAALFFLLVRLAARAPWSYDEYYHLALARLLRADPRLTSFPWTPFSVLAERFADKEPLFHLLLVPASGLPLETAAFAGAVAGQLALIASFAWSIWRLRLPHGPWLLVALTALGPMFALRVEMCRPHTWLTVATLVFLTLLLAGSSWKPLAAAAGLAGLAHTGGWITVAYAAVWVAAGFAGRWRGADGDRGRPAGWRRLAPVLAAAGGWLAGQLVHPNVPENFRLFALQNFLVPYQSAAGDPALRSQLGAELVPPGALVLTEQWPAFIAPLWALGLVARQPRLRTRSTFTALAIALGFLLVGSLFLRRFFELGAPLALWGLGLVLRERRDALGPPARRRRLAPALAALAVAAGSLWTLFGVRVLGFGAVSPPRAMAEWLGRNGGEGERVFTAQWADSAPLLYSAPQLRSLVALDPTFFWVEDPVLFHAYVAIIQGRNPDPARAIRERFGARWVTLWRAPAYAALARQLGRSPGVAVAFEDPHYRVLDLGRRPRPAG